jgi:pimeloyl-ACP methyl ester carboxylesterase
MAKWQINEIRKTAGNKACIIFIHGFNGETTLSWGRFPDLLGNEPSLNGWDIVCFGYESSLAPDMTGIWKGNPPIQTIADSLRTFISGSFTSKYDALVFIAHSMGGLVVQRALLDEHALARKVDKVILFGTPSFGLNKAWLFQLPILKSLYRQPRDMGKKSEFIRSLRSDWSQQFQTAIPFGFLAIAGSEDEFVPRSSSIDGFLQDQIAVVPGDHLTIVKPEKAADASFNLVHGFITEKAGYLGPWGSDALACARRERQQVVDQLEKKRAHLDRQALVNLALALDELGRRDDAMNVLGDARRHGTDAMGVLAGRHKRNWLQDRIDEEARAALSLYSEAYELCRNDIKKAAQAFYHGINLAFLALMYEADLGKARSMAQQVLHHCAEVKQNEQSEDIMWRRATEGEAHLILGDTDTAIECYTNALQGSPKPKPWQLASTAQQALLIADKLGDENAARSLLKLFSGDQP